MSQENRDSLQKQMEEAETKIKQLEHQNTRLENRGRYLQKGRTGQAHPPSLRYGRRDPGHLPEADRLPKTQFYGLMEQVFALPEVRRLVRQAQEEG